MEADCGQHLPALPLTTTTSSLLAMIAVGGLLYYQTSYINIIIIHLLMFISACPLRQHLFFLYYAGCVSTMPHVQHL